MKLRIFLVVILVAAAAVAGRLMDRQPEEASAAGRQEIHESYAVEPGARVAVRGINGSVEVRTAETRTAEVHVVSTARGTDNFEGRGVAVEHSPDQIIVRGEKSAGNKFWRWLSGRGGEVRHQVTLVLPRRVEFEAKGINGPLTVGEVEGSVMLGGVNGRVEVAGAGRHFRATGVNGSIKVSVARMGEEGMEMSGVNGSVEVRVAAAFDADVMVRGHNGGLSFDVPNLTSHEREGRSRAHARIGAGGPGIEFSGINGNIRFVSGAGGNTTSVSSAVQTVAPPPPPPPAPAVVAAPAAPPAPPAPPAAPRVP